MKKGFTLIELSIVLVVIGLLTGGIIAARSIIRSAQVNKVISLSSQYATVVENFYTVYKVFPGDSASFTPPGTEDQIIGWGAAGDGVSCTAGSPSLWNSEGDQSWTQASQAGMTDKNYVTFSPPLCGGTQALTYAYENFENGNLGPMIEIYGAKYNYGSIWVDKWPIFLTKAAVENNTRFMVILSPQNTLAMEAKTGAQGWVNEKMTGWVINVSGKCYNGGSVSCLDPNAKYGALFYFFPAR